MNRLQTRTLRIFAVFMFRYRSGTWPKHTKAFQDAVCKDTASGNGSILTESMWQPVHSYNICNKHCDKLSVRHKRSCWHRKWIQILRNLTRQWSNPNLVMTCPANRAVAWAKYKNKDIKWRQYSLQLPKPKIAHAYCPGALSHRTLLCRAVRTCTKEKHLRLLKVLFHNKNSDQRPSTERS